MESKPKMNRPKSVTMVGAILDPQTPDSDDNGSNSDSMRDDSIRTSEFGDFKKPARQGKPKKAKPPLTSSSDSQRPIGDTKENIASDPPSKSDVEMITVKTNEDLKVMTSDEDSGHPLVHLGRSSPTKSRKSPETPSSTFQKSPMATNESGEESASDGSSGGTSTRTKVLIYFCFCMSIVFILQGIIIGMVVDDKDDGNGTRGANVELTQSPVSVGNPTGSPTVLDIQATSYNFQSIASAPGAYLLQKVSGCDDCSMSIYPEADSELKWNAFVSIREIVVDSNGFFELNCPLYGVCGTIDLTESLDLAPDVSGNIYALWGKEPRRRTPAHHGSNSKQTPNSTLVTTLTISWEDVNLFGYDDTRRYRVNAQVKLSEQEIVFCFGEGNVNGAIFRSGILNYTDGYEYTPVRLEGFDWDGYSTTFPANSCDVKYL